MTISTIIFDVGGVILYERNQTARERWEKQLGLAQGSLREIVEGAGASAHAARGDIDEREVWAGICAKLGLHDDEIVQLQKDYWSSEEIEEKMVDFIRSLRPRYKIGILSNAWSDARKFHNSRFGMSSWIDDAVYSAEQRLLKPDPRIYHILLDRMKVRPEDCLFVDDLPGNVAAAEALGMKGIVCRDTNQTIAEINTLLTV